MSTTNRVPMATRAGPAGRAHVDESTVGGVRHSQFDLHVGHRPERGRRAPETGVIDAKQVISRDLHRGSRNAMGGVHGRQHRCGRAGQTGRPGAGPGGTGPPGPGPPGDWATGPWTPWCWATGPWTPWCWATRPWTTGVPDAHRKLGGPRPAGFLSRIGTIRGQERHRDGDPARACHGEGRGPDPPERDLHGLGEMRSGQHHLIARRHLDEGKGIQHGQGPGFGQEGNGCLDRALGGLQDDGQRCFRGHGRDHRLQGGVIQALDRFGRQRPNWDLADPGKALPGHGHPGVLHAEIRADAHHRNRPGWGLGLGRCRRGRPSAAAAAQEPQGGRQEEL